MALQVLVGKRKWGKVLCCAAKPQRKCSSACLNAKHVIEHFAESEFKSSAQARIVSVFISPHNKLTHSHFLSNPFQQIFIVVFLVLFYECCYVS